VTWRYDRVATTAVGRTVAPAKRRRRRRPNLLLSGPGWRD
jgi:hypothetical protein